MDSRVCTGRHTSTSFLPGRSILLHGRPCMSGRRTAESTHRSSQCRSVFDSSEGGPTCRFPTTDITGQDWRAFRAHLVAWEHSSRRAAEQSQQLQRPPYPPLVSGESWAHPLAQPEQGCLLLARKDHMKLFNGAVVLITSHDDSSGTLGYMLNKPSPLLVKDLQVLGAASGFKEAFGNQRLDLGGPVHIDHVTLLHRFVGIRGSQKIADGMFMGGMADAIRLVIAGLLRPSDFQLVLGMSMWGPGQLQRELDDGFWHVVSASPDLVFPDAPEPATTSTATTTNCATSSSAVSSSSPSSSSSSPSCSSAGAAAPRQQQQQLQRPEGGGGGGGGRRRDGGVTSPMYRRIARLAVRGA
ncbi:hypothetical protein PLESTB_000011900 [Pleodorina starrii]|uniref:Uncharacterized protein n=1 Tax=Pleodorina starrii TaxID=330485 RepID=A0A9W6EWJ8_9CHLO|nr:hypothetical protein PLESTM_001122800 [Pleodorina starrii]GLC47654.1 hypothetical protein PLESTB_000011900 [Pleodorina starrii]GLC70933.1 hypothetical protein PLESTF_001048200 [Pleodorina starrii]